MMNYKSPKLRSVDKTFPPFPLNHFPSEFAVKLGRELIYLLASKGKPILEGNEWEAMFAIAIGAQWKPSNIGLDDVVLGNTAWGAKSVKAKTPSKATKVRLISGRNSPVYSYGDTIDTSADPNVVGPSVLNIWNERVSSVRERFANIRTVVLVKSDDLTEVVVFELDTIRYDPELFTWKWNKGNNLEGYEKSTFKHKFTWQPHGSQFTIVEDIPEMSLVINIKQPNLLDKEEVLKTLGVVDKEWIKVTKKV
ncbi:hypothetical protein [Pedobacter flavus]|uniref:RES domain-containing protein n=1 Tax=Pedobacter flavus TaxID=3113906 RepID=A0ABU7GZL2_9SPHI|nr:hypothetical protein [Pedobacter sp. VNH31]MEE1884380.1 hypothetical protein [Pedobacter sp. VNH31]